MKKIKVSSLKPNTGNPRLIKDEKFLKLVESIKQFPVMMSIRPMIIDENNILLGGNMRLKAIQHLEMKEIPEDWVKKASELTEEEKKRFIITDNNSFGEYDWDIIANEWSDLPIEDWGVDLPDFVNKSEATEDDYEIPDEIKTDIVKGDLFELTANGITHRLLCGDSTNPDDVAKLMNGEKADMVFTDPPYNIDYGNIKHPKFKVRHIQNDNMDSKDFRTFCLEFAEIIKQFNKGCVYVCGAPGNDGRIMFIALDETLHNSTTIIWNKDQFTLGRGKYQNKYEPIWFGWVSGGEGFTTERNLTNVWDIPRPKASKEHPTMKPIELVANALKHASRNNDNVLDLFGGSGSTLVAAAQLNRRCFIQELDEKYCQVIIDRFTKLYPETEIKRNGVLWTKNTEPTPSLA